MQLPRGTFRTLKRGISLNSLADELRKERFTGYCTISYLDKKIILVFRNGTILLAGYDAMVGDAAWDQIVTLDVKDIVDAALSSLSEVQVDLALEFNTNARILQDPVTVTSSPLSKSKKEIQNVHHEAPKAVDARSIEREGVVAGVNPGQSGVESSVIGRHTDPDQNYVQSPQITARDEFNILHKELEALEAMDLESMNEKIRNNCMVMIRKLHLEHLIESKKSRDED
ncbi:MAG TPA: hypothetical protein VMW63_03020 [Methanoregulaceae archaeon]|nr:hypothetical protein [Methanoregulaceae archaeon]